MKVNVWSDGLTAWNGEELMKADETKGLHIPSPDNEWECSEGDYMAELEAYVRRLDDEIVPTMQAYAEEPRLDMFSDFPVIYEAYRFPTQVHLESFLHECLKLSFISGCVWETESDVSDKGFGVVVIVAVPGIDQVGTLSKKYLGKADE